jgi:hypothetical protein
MFMLIKEPRRQSFRPDGSGSRRFVESAATRSDTAALR